jgi:cardiolipin synthase
MHNIFILLPVLYYWLGWALRILALFIVPPNRKPTSSLAWLLIIFVLPIPGWIVFLVIGSNKLPKQRRDLQKTLDHSVESGLKSLRREHEGASSIIDAQVPTKFSSVSKLAKSLGHLPAYAGNHIKAYEGYDEAIKRIVRDIKGAKQTIYLEYYIFVYDQTTEPLFNALREAVGRGVTIRVLYDYIGSRRSKGYKQMKKKLRSYGIDARAALPLRLPGMGFVRPDLRNHRKMVIIDNRIGYTGSQNLIDKSYHRKDDIVYEEMVVRMIGPISSQLSAIFATDWFSETGEAILEDIEPQFNNALMSHLDGSVLQIIPSGPGYDDENNLHVFIDSIYLAQSSITIVSPYFVPTEGLLSAIVSASRRGVHVRMINSAAIDQLIVAHAQRSYYETLLDAGVEIYLYNKPALLHSKFMIIDNEITFVGSSNFDIRSFELDLELTLISYSHSFSSKMNKIAIDYQEASTLVNIKEWRLRHPLRKLLDNIARLTSSVQ